MEDISIAIEAISIIITVIIVPSILYWVRSVERKMKDLDERMRTGATRDDVKDMIDTKQEGMRATQTAIKEDLKEVRHTLDKVLDLLIKK